MQKKPVVDIDQFIVDLTIFCEGSRDQSILNMLYLIKRSLFEQGIFIDDGELRRFTDQ